MVRRLEAEPRSGGAGGKRLRPKNITVSDLLERNATPEDRQTHIDIADLLIRQRLADTNISAPDTQLPSPDGLYSDNPVMREVMKYISPQHWDKMDLLIRTFNLEVVNVTKNLSVSTT